MRERGPLTNYRLRDIARGLISLAIAWRTSMPTVS
jgi:hypothetical protein